MNAALAGEGEDEGEENEQVAQEESKTEPLPASSGRRSKKDRVNNSAKKEEEPA